MILFVHLQAFLRAGMDDLFPLNTMDIFMAVQQKDIVIIGSGNLGTQLTHRCWEAGHNIKQLCSTSMISRKRLAEKYGADECEDLQYVNNDSDIYICCVPDDQISVVASKLPPPKHGIVLHTSGTIDIHVFKGFFKDYGVLYPLSTFSADQKIDFSSLPVFIEATRQENLMLLQNFSSSLSDKTIILNSEQRRHLHLAAVFCSNFTNHLYVIAAELLKERGIPFGYLQHLIDETTRKLGFLDPASSQTGPAVREDLKVLEKHRALLKNHEDYLMIYNMISDSIIKQKHIRLNDDKL